MMWFKHVLDKISSAVGRGVDTQWWKSFGYFFLPLVVMSLNGHFYWLSPFWMAAVIVGLAVAKQVFWDVLWLKADFDVVDVLLTAAAVLVGIMFTWNPRG